MRNGQLNNLKVLTFIRQELRNGATDSEKILWEQLKGSKLAGRKFRRQHSIGLFVLDFYCPSERLAIEVDGGRLKRKFQVQTEAPVRWQGTVFNALEVTVTNVNVRIKPHLAFANTGNIQLAFANTGNIQLAS
ncbi:endonuclease domain-containing protein [Spirosoma pollinicola]|uniref:endonuclease domain-containing protein n=1 Tax=Spirosoma pollinicola TaxID=2057025 RepID=UPI001F0BD76C|nr:DUF559 domain-containing protein [Spirosoma pollinicola]